MSGLPPAIEIMPCARPIHAAPRVPGSKSLANRALLMAALAEGESVLRGIPDSGDVRDALSVLKALGAEAETRDGETRIRGRGFPGGTGTIRVGSAGTVGRFLPGILAAAGGEWRLEASAQLSARPLRPLLDALSQWGAAFSLPAAPAPFPLAVSGNGLSGGPLSVSAALSSQFASGVLMAAPLCRRTAVVDVVGLAPEERYVGMTIGLMRRFGITMEVEASPDRLRVRIPAPRAYLPARVDIEADLNTAAYFFALAALTGGTAAVSGSGTGSLQPGLLFLDVFRRLGCGVEADGNRIRVSGRGLPLRGGFSLDMRPMSEMAPTLAVMACFADRPVSMENLARVRGHETDRLRAVSSILAGAGVKTAERPDGLTVFPPPGGKPGFARVDPLGDHRLAMSFAVLGAAGNGIRLENPACAAKTCPGFFALLAEAGAPWRPARKE